MEYSRVLRPSEAKYKYLPLTKGQRDLFPPKDQIFKLKFKGKSYDLKVNNKDCIMITPLYNDYRFVEGDEIKIISKKDGSFDLSVIPSKDM